MDELDILKVAVALLDRVSVKGHQETSAYLEVLEYLSKKVSDLSQKKLGEKK